MKLVKATSSDSDDLIEFFKGHTLPAPIEIEVSRQGSFFDKYRIQSDDFATYALRDKENKIQAIATLIFRNGWVDNKPQKIGFATDLRVSNSRKAILEWTQHFMPVFEQEKKDRDCEFVFSNVFRGQVQAYNAFIRPRNTKRKMPRYHLYRRFKYFTVHGHYPWAHKPLSGIKIKEIHSSDQLLEYIYTKRKAHPIRFVDSPEDVQAAIQRWRRYGLGAFLVAFDSADNILGCTAPWNSQQVQVYRPIKFSRQAQSFSEALAVMSLFGLSKKFPKINEPMSFSYLTHFHAENPDIHFSLLQHALKMAQKRHFYVYQHYEGHIQSLAPRSLISARLRGGLYCVLSPSQAQPQFLRPNSLDEPPNIDLPLF